MSSTRHTGLTRGLTASVFLALAAPNALTYQALQGRLQVPSASGQESQGRACALDGAWAAVGAPERGGSGAVILYELQGSSWVRSQELVSSDGAGTGQRFGTSVAISGSTVVIGAFIDPGSGAGSGAAYVFEHDGVAWIEVMKLVSADTVPGDQLGYDVAIDGDILVLGAPQKDGGSFHEGAAYVSGRTGGLWSPLVKLLPSDPDFSDQFGVSVDVSGDRVVVGSQFDDAPTNSGSAYVFERVGALWSEEDKLVASDAGTNDQFGISVSISNDTVVCGAFGDEDAGTASGSAYVFERSGSSWLETQKLTASDGIAGDIYGRAVAIEGPTLIVGAAHSALFGEAPGAAYAYFFDGLTWGTEMKLVGEETHGQDSFGASVGLNGTTAIVGAPEDSNGGAAYAFGLLEPRGGYCFGDGSASACPCGNESAGGVGAGCVNSSGFGARLESDGSASVGADDLSFRASSLVPGQSALLFAGQNALAGGEGIVFGDGLRCAGLNVVRLGAELPDAGGDASWGPGLANRGGWSAGDTRFFQVWYHDPTSGPCGQGFNLSNGIRVELVD